MLKWEKDINGYNGHWMGGYIGFDDDCPLYKVGEDDEGWYYEYLPESCGESGYDESQEAMDAAEADYEAREAEIDWDDEPILSPEELDEILGDRLAHERLENEKLGLGW